MLCVVGEWGECVSCDLRMARRRPNGPLTCFPTLWGNPAHSLALFESSVMR